MDGVRGGFVHTSSVLGGKGERGGRGRGRYMYYPSVCVQTQVNRGGRERGYTNTYMDKNGIHTPSPMVYAHSS